MEERIVNKIINNIKKNNKCFVSEKHLQVAFAIEAEKVIKKAKVYPEYVFSDRKGEHVDLVVQVGKRKIGFEFKYIVRYCEGNDRGAYIKLRNQSALPVRRYNCLSDIERLEKLKKDKKIKQGYFYLITNEKQLWERNMKKKDTTDKDFRFESGIKHGKKNWNKKTGKGTKNGKDKVIDIKNDYNVEFKDFKDLNRYNFEGNTAFKQLLIKIK